MKAPANSGPGQAPISFFVARSDLMRLAMDLVAAKLKSAWAHVRQRIRLHLVNTLSDWIGSLEALYGRVETSGVPHYHRHSRPTANRHSRLVRR